MARVMEADPLVDGDSEVKVLGELLFCGEQLPKVREILGDGEGVFMVADHDAIWQAIQRLSRDGRKVDYAPVSHMTGIAADALLAMSDARTVDVEYHAQRLAELTRLRRFREFGRYIQTGANSAVLDFHGFREQLADQFALCMADGQQTRFELLGNLMDTMLVEARAAADGAGDTIVPTGYSILDGMMGGWRPETVTILAGRTSRGKTALGLNLALNAAHAGAGVLFFSLEMSRRQLSNRLLKVAADTTVKCSHRDGLRHYEELRNIVRANRSSLDVPLYVDDHFKLTSTMLRDKVALACAKVKPRLVVIDYLQLMHSTGHNRHASREERVAAISRDLKAVSREFHVAVLCLAQLNREAETMAPRLSHLRESGAIEQDADNILLMGGERQPGDVDRVIIDVAKQRDGPTGLVMFDFIRSTQVFRESMDQSPPKPKPNKWRGKGAKQQANDQEFTHDDDEAPF